MMKTIWRKLFNLKAINLLFIYLFICIIFIYTIFSGKEEADNKYVYYCTLIKKSIFIWFILDYVNNFIWKHVQPFPKYNKQYIDIF